MPKRNFPGQPNASPLRRIMLARGWNMLQLAVLSGVSQPTLRKLDRMNTETIGSIQIRPLLRLAMFLECAVTDLIPFLGTKLKKTSANASIHVKGGPGRPSKLELSRRKAIEQYRIDHATLPGSPPETR
jgi:transcriptional regulator with XRE-family HTH domain